VTCSADDDFHNFCQPCEVCPSRPPLRHYALVKFSVTLFCLVPASILQPLPSLWGWFRAAKVPSSFGVLLPMSAWQPMTAIIFEFYKITFNLHDGYCK
jgi:hypothetical protein